MLIVLVAAPACPANARAATAASARISLRIVRTCLSLKFDHVERCCPQRTANRCRLRALFYSQRACPYRDHTGARWSQAARAGSDGDRRAAASRRLDGRRRRAAPTATCAPATARRRSLPRRARASSAASTSSSTPPASRLRAEADRGGDGGGLGRGDGRHREGDVLPRPGGRARAARVAGRARDRRGRRVVPGVALVRGRTAPRRRPRRC